MVFACRWVVVMLFACAAYCWPAAAQAQPAAGEPAKPTAIQFRKLAPGVETTIQPDQHESEVFDQHDVLEILKGVPGLDWQPNFVPLTSTLKALATKTMYRRDIWCLEFTFKPLRMIYVDIPKSGGKFDKKLIYYMVFRVKNLGQHLHPELVNPPQGDKPVIERIPETFKIVKVDTITDRMPVIENGRVTKIATVSRDIRFMPIFSLESLGLQDAAGKDIEKAYLDKVMPVAVQAIRLREDPKRELLNTVEISQRGIPLSTPAEDKSVWGVATWVDVDLALDNFSVVIGGLNNAYRRTDLPPPNGWKPGNALLAGRKFEQKHLQLFFWRPGDELLSDERTVYFGNPKVSVDHRWIWR